MAPFFCYSRYYFAYKEKGPLSNGQAVVALNRGKLRIALKDCCDVLFELNRALVVKVGG